MSYFQIKKFSGIAPALSNRLLNEQFAQDAQNVDFTSGKLKPVRTDVEVTSSTQSSSHVVIEGIYPYEYTATAIAAANFRGILQSNVASTFSAYHFASNKGWHGYYGMWSTGTGTFSNPQFDISQIYAVSSAGYYAGSGFVGLVVTVEDLTRTTPFEKTHLGSSSSLKITTGNYDGESGAAAIAGKTGNIWIADFNGSDTAFSAYGNTRAQWTVTITSVEFAAIFNAGVDYYIEIDEAVGATVSTVALGTANKSYIFKPAALVGIPEFPPTRYITTNYSGTDAFVWAEYIKIPGDQKSKLTVGDELSGVTSGRTGTVTFFEFDGTDTFVFFERTHHVGAGTHSASGSSATVLTDAAETYTDVAPYTTDNALAGAAVTVYKTGAGASNVYQGTGIVASNDVSANTVTVNDLHNSNANDFDQNDVYSIGFEPNLELHTLQYDGGSTYWNAPGVEGIYSGMFNPLKNKEGGSDYDTLSGITAKTGLGFDPYFSNTGTVINQRMVRSFAKNDGTFDYNDHDIHSDAVSGDPSTENSQMEYANDYDYEWKCFHKNHPLSQLGGDIGNMGTIFVSKNAIIADQNQSGDPTASDNLSNTFIIDEGDVVVFNGWGFDTADSSTSTGLRLNYAEQNVGVVPNVSGYNTNASNAENRQVDLNMNWVAQPTATAGSNSTVPVSAFAAEHGGPYWLVQKKVKVHTAFGIHTVLNTNQSIVTGSATSDGSTTTFNDTTKNWETDYLVGKTLVNVTQGREAVITSNTATQYTFSGFMQIPADRDDTNPNYEFICRDTPQGTKQYEEYYIKEPIPGTTSIAGQVLTENFYDFVLLSVVSLDKERHVFTESSSSKAVAWWCSRYTEETVNVIKKNQNEVSSYLEFSKKPSIASSPVTADKFNRIYWTGEDYPRVVGEEQITNNLILGTTTPSASWLPRSYRLGIPIPREPAAVANVAGVATAGVADVLVVSYVYTYVSKFGEEGPPSPPSEPVEFSFGQAALLTAIGANDLDLQNNSEYNFGVGAVKRIYRSNTGSTDTVFQFLDEIPFSNTAYVDTKDPAYLAEVLPSTSWVGPPDDDSFLYPDGPMQGLIEMANGVFAGFTGNRLCFSEPFLPHAWPIEYRKTVEDTIVGLGAVSNGVFVLTEGKPYFFSGNDPSTMSGTQIDFAQACINVDSIVDMGDAIYYAGPDGLCSVSTTSAEILTRGLIDYRDWIGEFAAGSYRGARHEGRYVALFSSVIASDEFRGWVLDASNPESALSTLSRTGVTLATYTDPSDDNLYVVEGAVTAQKIKRFQASDTDSSYAWKSKEFTTEKPISMGWVSVHAESYPTYVGTFPNGTSVPATGAALEVTVVADGTTIFVAKLSRDATDTFFIQETITCLIKGIDTAIADTRLNQPSMRLPSFVCDNWNVSVTGDNVVNELCLSQSLAEIRDN